MNFVGYEGKNVHITWADGSDWCNYRVLAVHEAPHGRQYLWLEGIEQDGIMHDGVPFTVKDYEIEEIRLT